MLHLAAADEADLAVLSAQMQDALVRRADMRFEKARRRFALAANRFAWDALPEKVRRRAGLYFDDVTSVQHAGLGKAGPDDILSLLAITFEPAGELGGVITLSFSGGARVRLGVSCINAALDDLAGAWAAKSLPEHS